MSFLITYFLMALVVIIPFRIKLGVPVPWWAYAVAFVGWPVLVVMYLADIASSPSGEKESE